MSNLITENYMTKEQVCECLGINNRTLARWEQMRKGPPVTKIGRKVFYRIVSFETWLKDQEAEPLQN